MGVYIRGMGMPKNCWECHFGHGDSGVCVVDFKQHGDWDEPKNCPLVPVPPRGRLIDADALAERFWDGQCYFTDAIKSKLQTAPTVIEAEEGET